MKLSKLIWFCPDGSQSRPLRQGRGKTHWKQQAPGTVRWIQKHVKRAEKPEYWIFLGAGARMPLKRHLWLTHVGAIPAGHLIWFRDGNPRRCVLANLELISRAEAGNRNRNLEKMYETRRRLMATPQWQAIVDRRAGIMRRFWASTKGQITLRERSLKQSAAVREGRQRSPMLDMDDRAVAYWLFPRDAELRAFVLEYHPDLIQAKRAELRLRRAANQLLDSVDNDTD